MHELDVYFEEELKKEEENINIMEGRKEKYIHPRYNYFSKRKSILSFPEFKEKLNKLYQEHGPESEIFLNFKQRYESTKRIYKELDKTQRTFPSRYLKKQLLRSFYVRYADD